MSAAIMQKHYDSFYPLVLWVWKQADSLSIWGMNIAQSVIEIKKSKVTMVLSTIRISISAYNTESQWDYETGLNLEET